MKKLIVILIAGLLSACNSAPVSVQGQEVQGEQSRRQQTQAQQTAP
jgi:starvation-inducible outer membrane lipoprotein